jgi:hypothetical protein
MSAVLFVVTTLQAAEPAKLSPVLENYKASLQARSAALQKELLSGRLSRPMKFQKSAEIKQVKAMLADLAKGKLTAEPFHVVADRRQPGTGPYKPQPGQVFSLSAEDYVDGQLVYTAESMSARPLYRGHAMEAGQTIISSSVETVRVPIAIRGEFVPGVYVVVDGPALQRIQ